MKILITYASTGAGHFKAAQALYNYIKANCPEIDLELMDVLEKANALFRFFYAGGYSFLIKHMILLWRLVFWLTDFKATRAQARSVVSIINRFNAKSFLKFLIDEQFDCIICAHFLPSEISAYAKKTNKINSRLITLITDFGVHGFWVSDGTDMYIVATELTQKQLVARGVEQNIIRIFGIPIDARFLLQYDPDLLHKKFDTDKNKFTVLIVTGSFGIGPIAEIVALLCKDVQVLVVCAENRRLYEVLKRKNYPNVNVFGFVDYIPQLMSISDCIITKPGGMTISESLAKDLFPIFITAIPGQETENINVLAQYKVGLYTKNAVYVRDIILDLMHNPEKLKTIKESIRKIKQPNAAREICHVVCLGSAGCAC